MKLGIIIFLCIITITSCTKDGDNSRNEVINKEIKTSIKIVEDINKSGINIKKENEISSNNFISIEQINNQIGQTDSVFVEKNINSGESEALFIEIDLNKKIKDPNFDLKKGNTTLKNIEDKIIKSSFN